MQIPAGMSGGPEWGVTRDGVPPVASLEPWDEETPRFVDQVDRLLGETLDAEGARLVGRGAPELETLVDALRKLVLAPSKRVRPSFCYWAWRGAGHWGEPGRGSSGRDILRASVALELVHTAAIVHDDLMDGSERRRGGPSLHYAFEDWRQQRGLTWEAEGDGTFGASAALLAGHFCLTWAERLVDELAPSVSTKARPIFRQLREEASAGQYLDLLGSVGALDGSFGSWLRLAEMKTASYTVARPAELGGVIGGASPGLLAAYRSYGRELGVAYQIADDIADVFANPVGDGGGPSEDLASGKLTALVALARAGAGPEQARILGELVGHGTLDAAGSELVRDTLVAAGALDRARQMVADRVVRAKEAIESVRLPRPARDALVGLADGIAQLALSGDAASWAGGGRWR